MTLPELLEQLRTESADFEDTLAWVATHYQYTPTAFSNGETSNAAGQNEGACRVFALGQLEALSPEHTLLLFGRHLRDVLADPSGSNHANIRQFQRHGWSGVSFAGQVLRKKT